MKKRSFSLGQLHIPTPCHANWEQMTGDDQKRFCGKCQKHVHNLSAMSRSEVEKLLANQSSLCVQFVRDSSGKTLTREDLPPKYRQGWRAWTPAALYSFVTFGLLTLIGCRPVIAGGLQHIRDDGPTTAPAINKADGEPRILRGEAVTTPSSNMGMLVLQGDVDFTVSPTQSAPTQEPPAKPVAPE